MTTDGSVFVFETAEALLDTDPDGPWTCTGTAAPPPR
jgi:hypothetical protein